jgi:hypothetical protein
MKARFQEEAENKKLIFCLAKKGFFELKLLLDQL